MTAMSYWVLTGDQENWRRGVSDRIWGVVAGLQSSWETLQRDDFLFFYAKAPISRIFGTGIVRDKFWQDRPLWVDEIKAGKVLYALFPDLDGLSTHLASLYTRGFSLQLGHIAAPVDGEDEK